jgi:hypothetical protein
MRCGDKKAGSLTYSIPSDNWYVIVPPPVEEESDNLSNGRRQRDDGSAGVANSDQIVGVHLILAGGDGRSLMPPKGYTIKSRLLAVFAQFPGQPVGRRWKPSSKLDAFVDQLKAGTAAAQDGQRAPERALTRVRSTPTRSHKMRATRLEGGRPAGEIIARRTVSAGWGHS